MIIPRLNNTSQGLTQILVILDELRRFELVQPLNILETPLSVLFNGMFSICLAEIAHRRRIQNHNACVLDS